MKRVQETEQIRIETVIFIVYNLLVVSDSTESSETVYYDRAGHFTRSNTRTQNKTIKTDIDKELHMGWRDKVGCRLVWGRNQYDRLDDE